MPWMVTESIQGIYLFKASMELTRQDDESHKFCDHLGQGSSTNA